MRVLFWFIMPLFDLVLWTFAHDHPYTPVSRGMASDLFSADCGWSKAYMRLLCAIFQILQHEFQISCWPQYVTCIAISSHVNPTFSQHIKETPRSQCDLGEESEPWSKTVIHRSPEMVMQHVYHGSREPTAPGFCDHFQQERTAVWLVPRLTRLKKPGGRPQEARKQQIFRAWVAAR